MSTANSSNRGEAWLTSKEAKTKLRVSSCDLMHLREAGALRVRKKGNAFLYAKDDVERSRGNSRCDNGF